MVPHFPSSLTTGGPSVPELPNTVAITPLNDERPPVPLRMTSNLKFNEVKQRPIKNV